MTQVFISYSRKDLDFVTQLAADLKKAGLEVWYDVSNLGGGSRWRVEIESALRSSQYVVVVLSPDSIKSEWVEREFIFSSNLNLKIIPLMYRTCDLPLNYVNMNYIDARGNEYVRNFGSLLKALEVEAGDGKQAARPPTKIKPRSIFLIGGGTIVIAALLVLALMRNMSSTASTPTDTKDVTQAVPAATTRPSLPEPTESTPPSVVPTDTLIPTVETLTSEITDGSGVKMILVPEGKFTMGSDMDKDNDNPPHTVFLNAFYMDKFEVTNALYKSCVDSGPCEQPHNKQSTAHPGYYDTPQFADYPVIWVDWYQAKTYCEWRNARLPSEAEWEKAARGMTDNLYPWGNDVGCGNANYNHCNSDIVAVGSYKEGVSPFGIHDLGGNVWEWVNDWYSETYYRNSPEENPQGPTEGVRKILHGGTWDSPADNLYVSKRLMYKPAFFTEGIGFRCARDATP